MKQYIIFILLISSLGACRKNDVTTGDYHLVKISTPSNNGVSGSEFTYDPNGRMLSKSITNNGSPIGNITTISYLGNTVTINPFISIPSQEQRQILIQLNAANRPGTRTENTTKNLHNEFGPQYNFTNDQRTYVYGADGLLIKYTGIIHDSLSYYPAANLFGEYTSVTNYSVVLTYSSSNLSSIVKTFQGSYTARENGGMIRTTTNSSEETSDFFYDRGFKNNLDPKNDFLYSEVLILPFTNMIPDFRFSNFPNRARTRRISRDRNGIVIGDVTTGDEPELKFDGRGFLASVKYPNWNEPESYAFSKF